MIDISLVKIIRPNTNLEKHYNKRLKQFARLSKRYPVFLGIDFEFNTKKIALMQLLFEIHKDNQIYKKYYIIYPPELDMTFFKEHILGNKNILKILHGSESLDIPYIVDDLFLPNEFDLLINFMTSMIDTRY